MSSHSFRRICAIPLMAFDSIRLGMQTNPKTANYTMMMSSFVAVLVLGNGADKLTTRYGGIANEYESIRRSKRHYVPYFLVGYQFKHPQLKQ